MSTVSLNFSMNEIWCEKHYKLFHVFGYIVPATQHVLQHTAQQHSEEFVGDPHLDHVYIEKLYPLCCSLSPVRFRNIEALFIPLS